MPIFFNTKSFESIFSKDELPKDASLNIHEEETGKLNKHTVYLATSETQSIGKAKRFGCFLFAYVLALFKQTIGSAVYFKKAATGRQVVAITVNETGSDTLKKISDYNKGVLAEKTYEMACKSDTDKNKLLKEAADLGNPKAIFEWAMILKKEDKLFDAIELLEKIGSRDTPLGIKASFELGQMNASLDRNEEAIRHLERFQNQLALLRKTDEAFNGMLEVKANELLSQCYEREGDKQLSLGNYLVDARSG